MNDTELSFAENFQKYFAVSLAVNADELRSAYRVRYRVYCEELGYEPADRFPNGEEVDDYDAQSYQLLITHKSSGLTAGCVRLVKSLPSRHSLLPFEQSFPEALDPEFFSRMDLERESICEISRLAVDSRFRRRFGESFSRLGGLHAMDITSHEQRSFSLIAEAAFMAATALTSMAGRTNIFALMEPYLCRLLGRSGIHFMRVGKDIEHHGWRAPYFLTTASVLDNMRADLVVLYQGLYDQLEASFKAIDVAA